MATDYDTAQHQHELYRFCYENTHQDWVNRAATNFNFWDGRQWRPEDKAKLEREGRPALTFNIVRSLVRSMKGMQRALRNDVRFLPANDASVDDARVMDAVWMHTQQQNQFDFLESDIYQKGLVMDRAYYDVRVMNDEQYQGHVRIKGLRSQDVILDVIEDYDPAFWPRVFTRDFLSNSDIAELFGKEHAEALRGALPTWYSHEDKFMSQMMGQLPYYRYEGSGVEKHTRSHLVLNHQYYVYKDKDVFIDIETGDRKEIPETWDRDRISAVLERTQGLSTVRQRVKTVRWDITCEGEVLFSEDSPYKWFTVVPFFPDFIDGVASGPVTDLIAPQELYNKITSQELHIVNTTANSGWKVKNNNLKNMTWRELEAHGSRSGFVAVVDEMDGLDKITPNSIPQGHDRISSKAEGVMRSISGVSEQGRGFAREDVAGEAILSNQAAQEVNFAGYMANLHRTKQLLAERVLDAVQTTYTESRTIMINRGSMFRPEMEAMMLNSVTPEGRVLNDVTQGRYTTTLVPAPSRTSMSESDFKLLLGLREAGIGIPDDLLIELSPASNKAQIIEKLVGDSNERAAQEAQQAEAAMQVEMDKQQATAEKERSAAALNQSRAEKFLVEAQTDPDARYAEVEHARIESDTRAQDRKHDLDERRLDMDREFKQKDLALRIAEMDARRQEKASPEKPAKDNQR